MANYYTKQLEKNLEEIGKLIETPETIKKFAIDGIRLLQDNDLTNTVKGKIKNIISSLTNISEKTIKNNYEIIYNQLCVLSVSSLSAILEKYFINFAQANWQNIKFPERFKMTLRELKERDFKLKPVLGYIILEKDNSINFQDLQSIRRAFDEYCNKKLVLDEKTINNVIYYQQCRHLIVHKNGIVNIEFLKKTNDKKYKVGDKIQMNESDWDIIKKSFLNLVEKITKRKNFELK